MTLLIFNGRLISHVIDEEIKSNQAIYIEADKIVEVGDSADLLKRYPDAEKLDAADQYMMPGSICAHTHFYGAYARGMAIAGAPPADFPHVLRQLWWPLDKALDADSIRASALVCLVDAIKHGTTTLFDHHASPNHIDGSLDIISQAVIESGLRAVLCYEVTDRDGMDKMYAGIDENIRHYQAAQGQATIASIFGLHASLTLNDESLKACAEAIPDEIGIHVHVAEHESDEEDSKKRSGKRVVERLDDFGLWRPDSIAAHCIHVDADERSLLLDRGVWVTHQPRSNMNNGVGAADIDGMLAQGIPVCLGNDGFSNNMWADWKAAYLLQKVIHRDPRRANGSQIAEMALYHNRDLAECYFGNKIGMLEAGALADVILVDYHPFTPFTSGNLPWHIIFGFESSMVTATIASGRILMQDRVITCLDEKAVAEEALALAPAVWERYRHFANQIL